MPYTTAAKNEMIDALAGVAATSNVDFVSLHTAFPGNGPTASNEVSGGSYARQSITWNVAASGLITASNTPVVPVPVSTTVAWLGYFTLVTAGVYLAYSPLNANPLFYTVNTTTEVFTSLAHGLVDTDQVVFYGGAVPGGLVEGTIYFVISATTDTFQVSATEGGGAIDITSAGDFNTRVSIIVPETFASAGDLTISSATLDLNL